MSSVSTRGTQKRPGSPRPAFVFALLGSLGVAPAAVQGVEPPAQPVRPRRLGSGTPRAVRLVPVQVSFAGSASHPAVTVQPVVIAMSAPSSTIQRPDSARRHTAALGPVQYATLDDQR